MILEIISQMINNQDVVVCISWSRLGSGVSGNSRESREYKPQISLPVAFCYFPSRSREKGSFGRELGQEILSLFTVLRMAGQGMKMN